MSSHKLYKFFAFISYSRKDAAFAEKVQSFLEHFKLPSKLCRQYPDKPKNLRPIYRDKTDLAIDNLKDALQIGLENSFVLSKIGIGTLFKLSEQLEVCCMEELSDWEDSIQSRMLKLV